MFSLSLSLCVISSNPTDCVQGEWPPTSANPTPPTDCGPDVSFPPPLLVVGGITIGNLLLHRYRALHLSCKCAAYG